MTIFLKLPEEIEVEADVVDVIGLMYDVDGEPLPGWHINILNEVPAGLEQYRIYPETPLRVFAIPKEN